MSQQSWNIRKAKLDDSVPLESCMHKAYALYSKRMQGKRLPPMDLDYAQEIQQFPTWVAVIDSQIVGGITLVLEQDYASIANVGINPEFQGLGLGSGLLQFAEEQAMEKNYREMRLATHVLLTENLSLYRHLGWHETGRDEVRVYMSKNLSHKN